MMNLKESLNKIDLKSIDDDTRFYDVRSLYESVEPKLTAQDKTDLKQFLSNPNISAVDVANKINSLASNQKMNEDVDLSDTPYIRVAHKMVNDYDGFRTDYTMYLNLDTGEYICIFGDCDIYSPLDTEVDAGPFEDEDEAFEWFENYNGFDEDEFDESLNEAKYADILGGVGTAAGAGIGMLTPIPFDEVAGAAVGGMAGRAIGGTLDAVHQHKLNKKERNESMNEDAFDSHVIKSGKVDVATPFSIQEFDEDDGWITVNIDPGTYNYRILNIRGWKPRQMQVEDIWLDVADHCVELNDLLDGTTNESLTESTNEADAWSYQEISKYLAKETDKGKKPEGTIRTYYKSEKDHAKTILSRFYKVVEVSDGRMSADEDMSYVVAYADPKRK